MEKEENQEIESQMDMSQDLFADCSPGSSNLNQSSEDVEECPWRGSPLSELCLNTGKFLYPSVKPSHNHTVLFQLPVVKGQAIKPHPTKAVDIWNQDHVRMPHSMQSLYPVTETELRTRWELVKEALSRPILCCQDLEEAILFYNSKYSLRWNFEGLHTFFSETLEEEETEHFFTKVLPDIIKLALSLPELITGAIPMLRRGKTHSISLTQRQISSLLANAFLCTFPRRNTNKRQSEYNTYPDINFNRLFIRENSARTQEKLKCLVNYFRRVCTKVPEGVVTYSRHHVPSDKIPEWDNETGHLPKLHVSKTGTIESNGGGMLQMDFANKFVGGGVLGQGCVQEEIRFIICPELIAARLFTERLDPTEALLVTGVERYSNYEGYADNFHWAGDCQDQTPCDTFGRRYCSLVAVDAVHFRNAHSQYSQIFINRELNKAYTGFSFGLREDGRNTSVATGNWGCGAFKGDANLKCLLQLMAAGKTGRDVAYFTFGDMELRDRLANMHDFLTKKNVTIGQLWKLLCCYSDVSKDMDLYTYLYKAVNNDAGGFSRFRSQQIGYRPANHGTKPKEKQIHTDEKEENWFLSSEDIEAALEDADQCTEKHEQNETKSKFLERKSYSVASELCVQRQSESWASLNESKKDFSKCKSVNKIESEISPELQRTGPTKRKISDYFSPCQKS